MEPPGRKLPAAGVDRQFAVQPNALSALDEGRRFASATKKMSAVDPSIWVSQSKMRSGEEIIRDAM
jgi:hypothetical protein